MHSTNLLKEDFNLSLRVLDNFWETILLQILRRNSKFKIVIKSNFNLIRHSFLQGKNNEDI